MSQKSKVGGLVKRERSRLEIEGNGNSGGKCDVSTDVTAL